MGSAHDEWEKKLQASIATPISLPLEFLKDITCDFSTELVLGEGGFGVVYKGSLRSGKIIAVKKLRELRLKEETFQNEVSYLMGIKHQNVVQFLGYCAESKWEAIETPSGSGKHVLAEIPTRLLCFEYVSNKSLGKHISDESAGLEWNMRFDIIKGICNGLHFLHEECRIVHLDLKPENILMDSTMMPKITDFGLSRIFGEQQTRIVTDNHMGTHGYMAPEYLFQGVVSRKADIFSLGVLVIEIITGHRDYPYFQQDSPHIAATYLQQFTEKVLESWRNKFLSTTKFKPVERYTQQVRHCIDIALQCVDPSMEKRPTAKDIIQMINAVDQVTASSNELLVVHPLEICFPVKPNKFVSCSVHLKNKNDKQVVFRLMEKRRNWMCFLKLPLYGIVPPRSTYTLVVTTLKKENLPKEREVDLILQNVISDERITPFKRGYDWDQYFENANELDNPVNEVAVKAIYAMPRNKPREVTTSSNDLLVVHPLELCFPIEPNKVVSCSVHLKNKKDKQVVFRLMEKRRNWMCFLKLPLYGIVPPRSTYTLVVTTLQKENLPKEREVDLILQNVISDERITAFERGYDWDQYFENAKELDNPVNELAVKAIYATHRNKPREAAASSNKEAEKLKA